MPNRIQKFIEKNELPFTLIADTDKKLVEQFGVWGEKSMYGRKYMGTFRTTFIINEEGVIRARHFSQRGEDKRTCPTNFIIYFNKTKKKSYG